METGNSMEGIYNGPTAAEILTDNVRGQIARQSAEQRLQTISDIYGADIKPQSFQEYRERTGQKTKIGKALLYAVVGAALVYAVAGAALVTGAAAVFLGTPGAGGVLASIAVGGAIAAAGLSVGSDQANAMKGYEGYINEYTREARAEHDAKIRQQTIEAVQAANGRGDGRQWAQALGPRTGRSNDVS